MRLVVIGSSSAGNSYALEGDCETLLIEAGLPLASVRKMTNLGNVVGTLVSHHHGDHAKYADEFSMRFPIAAPKDVLIGLHGPMLKSIYEGKTESFGGFSFAPFQVPHSNADGSPCINVGYLIRHKEMGTALFATDTYSLPYLFPDVEHFIIEANYSDLMLDASVRKGEVSSAQADRIRLGHFSADNAIDTIRRCGTRKLLDVTFIHLSSRHASPETFKKTGELMLGVPVNIAKSKDSFFFYEIRP